ncbi:MAG TPA: ABC transporter permease [Bellilinea sp.]|nr:ABC transporter permease [Bellilinea sp.]
METSRPRLRFIKTDNPPVWVRPLIPVLALVITFILTSGLIIWAKANPLDAYYQLLISPLMTRVSAIEILVSATPLLLTGAAVTFAFAAGYYNIGAEGQLFAGAIAAAGLGMAMEGIPGIITIPVILIVGFAAGMAWAWVPAILKVKLQVDEVVTTLLLNSVMGFIVSALLNGPWRDPNSGWPQSAEIGANAIFFKLIPRSRLNFGFLIGLIVIAILWFILSRTSFGLKMRAVGLGKPAARFAGINVGRTTLISALVSGGIAGIAGVALVCGIQYHLISDLSAGYGYTGIIIATLGSLNPIGVTIASLFFGLVDAGAQNVSRVLGVPVYLGEITQAAMLLVALGLFLLQRYRVRRM